MKAKLVERGASAEHLREISLNQNEFLIGRGTDCDLRLRISNISRHHCLIRLANDEATVVDLGSSNGTYLNGQRVRSQAALHSGDEIQVGTCRFLVKLGDESEIDLDTGVGADPFSSTLKLPPGAAGKKISSPQGPTSAPVPTEKPAKPGAK
jgi:pSer/pThr/pTyr-binding forkhead associated (FHA) protein